MARAAQAATRKTLALFEFGFDQVRASSVVEIAVVEQFGLFVAGVIGCVQSEVGNDVINVAVVVQIASCNAVPPAKSVSQPCLLRSINQSTPVGAGFVDEDLNRAPIMSD